MKSLTLSIKFDFSGDIPEDMIPAIAAAVADRLEHEVKEVGILPDNCDAWTQTLTVYGRPYPFADGVKEERLISSIKDQG